MPNQFLSPEGDLENYFVSESWLIDQYVGDTLWTWGFNNSSQLGINIGTGNRCTPVTTFTGGTNWKQVSAGSAHSAAIKTDGTLWTWGANAQAELGINSAIRKCTPVQTSAGGTDWKQVSCGSAFMAAIKTDGTLWTWGFNGSGQLGINNITTRSTPVQVFGSATNWKQVSCGGAFAAAIKTDGTLWTWGANSQGQLGNNNTTTRCTPVTTSVGGTDWRQVSCGSEHVAAIKTDGTLWAWGDNSASQLGNFEASVDKRSPVPVFGSATNWKQVSCGGVHTAAVKTDGTLWTWGRNIEGQLGINITSNSICTPVQVFGSATNWKQVSCGTAFTAAIKTDGTLWTWGANDQGQLGINNTTTRCTPVTTSVGGTNWKQVNTTIRHIVAVTSGTDPTYFIS